MKKRFIFASILAATTVISLASCNQPTGPSTNVNTGTSATSTSTPISTPTSTPTSAPTSTPTSAPTSVATTTTEAVKASFLEVSDYKINFSVNDTFEVGDLKCIATLLDNTTQEISLDKLTVDSTNVKMDKAGTYDVTVSYGGASFTYSIYVNHASIEDAIIASLDEQNKLSGGTLVTKNELVNSTTGYDMSKTKEYTYGESFVKINFVEDEKTHYYSIYNGNVLGVEVSGDTKTRITSREDGGEIFIDETEYIGTDFFSDGYMTAFGAEGLVDYLYEYMNSDVYGQVTEKIENGVYSFGFNVIQIVSGKYFFKRVEVEFTLNEFGNIASANCKLISYNDNIIESLTDEAIASLPLTLTKIEDEDGKSKDAFILNEDASACSISSYIFTQNHGERCSDNENPYTIDKVQISSFKVYDTDDNEIEDNHQYNLDLDNGNEVGDETVHYKHKYTFEYNIKEILPETAISTIDRINVEIVGTYKNGKTIDSKDYLVFASLTDNHLIVRINTPCDFDLVLSSDHFTKTIKYSVDYETPYEIGAKITEGEDNSSFVVANEYTMYQSNQLYIMANIPDNYDPNYSLELSEDAKATLTKTTLNGVECYKFVASEEGTYIVNVKAAPKADGTDGVTSSLTIVVNKNPDVSEILSGDYEVSIGNTDYTISFTPSTDNPLAGTAVITNTSNNLSETVSYSYTADSFITNHVSGESFKYEFDLSSKYVLSLTSGRNKYALARPGQSEADLANALALLKGTYSATFSVVGMTYDYKFIPDSDSAETGKIEVSDGSTTGVYTYTFDIKTRKIDTVYQSGSKHLANQELTITTDLKIHTSFFGGADLAIKEYDINQILSGKYTVTDSSQTYEIEFKDDILYVTRISGSQTRTGTYSYKYNDSTGEVVLSKISESKNTYITNNLFILDGVLSLKGLIMNGDGTSSTVFTPFVKEKIKISSSFVGEWTSEDFDDSIVITEDSVSIGGIEAKIVSFDGTTLVVNDSYYDDISITLNESGLSAIIFGDSYTFTKKVDVVVPGNLVGVWSNEDASIEITSDGFIYEDIYTYEIISITNTTIVAVDTEDPTYKITITINADGTLDYQDNIFSKENDVSDDTVKVNANFVGTWVNGDNSFVITEDSVKFGNNTLTVVKCTETELTVYGTGFPQDTIKLSEDKKSIVSNGLTYTKDETSTELAILEKYLGTWYGDDDETEIVIGETIAIVPDLTFVQYVSCTDSSIVIAFNDFMGPLNIEFTFEDGKLVADSNLNEIVFTKSTTEAEVVKVNANFVGTWVNGDNSFVITEDSVKFGNNTLTVVKCTDTELTVYGTGFPQDTIKLSEDKKSIVSNGLTYTKGE